jgi:hypothetical protein
MRYLLHAQEQNNRQASRLTDESERIYRSGSENFAQRFIFHCHVGFAAKAGVPRWNKSLFSGFVAEYI